MVLAYASETRLRCTYIVHPPSALLSITPCHPAWIPRCLDMLTLCHLSLRTSVFLKTYND